MKNFSLKRQKQKMMALIWKKINFEIFWYKPFFLVHFKNFTLFFLIRKKQTLPFSLICFVFSSYFPLRLIPFPSSLLQTSFIYLFFHLLLFLFSSFNSVFLLMPFPVFPPTQSPHLLYSHHFLYISPPYI